jgi:hypothetical protein
MQRALFPSISLCFCLAWASAAEAPFSVTVEAGAFDRRGTVATFALPPEAAGDTFSLQREGRLLPLQVGQARQAAFVIEDLKPGGRVTYTLVAKPAGASAASRQIAARKAGTQLKFSLSSATEPAGQSLLDYQAEPGELPRSDIKPVFRRGGYLHPVRTLSGKIVTDDYPANHVHHHGVWWAWTNTEFDGRKPDFWNMGDGKGRVEFVALDQSWGGPVHGGFRARHRFVDLTAAPPVTALDEMWEVRVYAPPAGEARYWYFDLVSEQQCATGHALKLPEYRYGGVGVRGNWAWNGADQALFLTSEGETDRVKGHATRARWCDLGGLIDGTRAGIAVLGHPDNFRAPQPMRLHPTEPFFNFAPQQAGDMELKPGVKYVSRYRFVVHDGPPDRGELDRLWNDYAHPPIVRVTAAP